MSERDPLLKEAIEIINNTGKKSVSLLQRKLRIGYMRAAHLLDEVEKRNEGAGSETLHAGDVACNVSTGEGCVWEEGAMFGGLSYWWRKTCTGEGDTSLWVEAWDGPLPERCPDCGRVVVRGQGQALPVQDERGDCHVERSTALLAMTDQGGETPPLR